ncbi:MAG: FAD-dependent monooxygenase [Rhodobacteraceae bacterium]|nr:FAD-dependent monooxygenase [Paracoccaceae bacterium]
MDNPRRPTILPDMTFDADIVIVGGGLNGSVLALALAQSGHRVTVIDALTETIRGSDAFDGRSYALALGAQRMLATLGLWPDLAADAQPMLEIKVGDGRVGTGPSAFFMHFDHAEIEEGPMGHMIEDRHLRRALLRHMAETPGLSRIGGTAVVDQKVTPSGATVTLADGREITARVLVGSDGRDSGTARRAGIRRIGWRYGQTALVCAIEHALPHGGVAHQFFMPAGPLAILPLTGNRSSIVWSETDAAARRIARLPEADYLEVLRPRFGDFLGDIALAGKRFSYPLELSLARTMIGDRLALIGDAAHGVHPIAGQGLNAGLRDVAALAQTLTEAARRGEDIGAVQVLERYQQWRRFDVATLALATDTFNRLFSNDNPLLRLGRDMGMGAVNAMPWLRRGFIREAAGLTGDLPLLLQGRQI